MTSPVHPRASSRLVVVLMALVCLSAGHQVWGQSLGEVARKGEADRKTVKASGKVYTNDSLRSEPTPTPPTSSAASTAPSSPSGAAPGAEQDRAKEEASWRQRIKAERDALERAQTFAAALQSQINGLYAEFTACQAPPQCNAISARRQKAIAELDQAKKDIERHTKGVTDIQDEARRAGVPAGWVR